MNRFVASICILFAWPFVLFAQAPLQFSAESGWMIHDASYLEAPDWWPPELPWNGTGLNTDPSYRYGPAMIRYANDNLHFWSCSEGDASVADYIRYRHSSDGGRSWSDDVIALSPTVASKDGWAICDPNVIKIGRYYYLAYTATDRSFGAGLNNQVFIARSLRPDGGFEKWNGSGWGGLPEPIISYTGSVNHWGLGEPNMVIKGDTLFFYYTEDLGVARTRVATAAVNDDNWPANLNDRGYAIATRDLAEDQSDVKYLPEVDRFIAIAIASRFMEGSYVHVWESTDGLNFTPIENDQIATNIQAYAHNLGMSGDYLGHAQMGRKEYIAYSYGQEWGRWNSWINKANITGADWVPGNEKEGSLITPILMLLFDQ